MQNSALNVVQRLKFLQKMKCFVPYVAKRLLKANSVWNVAHLWFVNVLSAEQKFLMGQNSALNVAKNFNL